MVFLHKGSLQYSTGLDRGRGRGQSPSDGSGLGLAALLLREHVPPDAQHRA